MNASNNREPSRTLWACLRVPDLPVDVFARAWSEDALAQPFVVSSGGHYPRVIGVNAAARHAGVRPDQLISAALALAPAMAMRERDPALEAAALAELATAALAFTPMVSLAPPDAVLVDIGPSLRLFGGLRPLVGRLLRAVRALGYEPALGLAPTPTAALVLARTGGIAPVLDAAKLPGALADVPLRRLDLASAARDVLTAAGIATFGEIVALPRAGLARRVGTAVVDALDRALGRVPDARLPYEPPPRFEARLALPAPADDAQALGFALHRLVLQLSQWLTARGLGVTRLTLTLGHERYVHARGVEPTVVPFALGAPARALAHLTGVLRERLVRVALPAPVETLHLASDETAALAGRNLGLLPGDEAGRVEVPLFERLRARLGDDAVMRLAPCAEHRPERAQREAALVPGPARSAKPDDDLSASAAALAAQQAHALPPRPVWLLEAAQPIGVELESRPWILRDGPERIESGWWDGADLRRDYFVAETPDGALRWIYRDHRYGTDDGEWFLHGLYA
jgi:protein ImuB